MFFAHRNSQVLSKNIQAFKVTYWTDFLVNWLTP